jgi:hypothetical protein
LPLVHFHLPFLSPHLVILSPFSASVNLTHTHSATPSIIAHVGNRAVYVGMVFEADAGWAGWFHASLCRRPHLTTGQFSMHNRTSYAP